MELLHPFVKNLNRNGMDNGGYFVVEPSSDLIEDDLTILEREPLELLRCGRWLRISIMDFGNAWIRRESRSAK